MKKTRRIEIVTYTRQVTLTYRDTNVDQAQNPATKFLTEIVDLFSRAPEESPDDGIGAVVVAPPPQPLLPRLLKVGLTFCRPSRNGTTKVNKK